jgi:protein-S-isoprenylcysteine O-methyltransferase Ste14
MSGAAAPGGRQAFLETKIPPPVWWLLAAVAMWLADRWVPVLRLDADVAWPLRALLAGAIALAGLALVGEALLRFRRAHTTMHPLHPEEASRLVVAGTYRYTRNPMYLGLLLLLAAWALWLGSLSVWLVLPLFVAALTRLQIVPEERALAAKFGADYRAYRGAVRRWFGRRRGGR